MKKSFIYGMAVSGENFTDRIMETKRIKANFENGVNTILISPRRMGKTSLVNRVCETIDTEQVRAIRLDIYDCRSEYDFYEKFACEILKQTAGKIEQLLADAKEFLGRITPRISISPDSVSDYSISLGVTPKEISPEDILSLPEKIATRKGIHLVICIDEFQQIGEFPDSLNVQKRIRSIWQHFRNVSFCLYGSKRHMLENMFQHRNMPFYQFGDITFLDKISRRDWIDFIVSRFKEKGKRVSEDIAEQICRTVDDYSSYVQQLSWNLFVLTENEATEELLKVAVEDLLMQTSSLFINQIAGLTTHQMNFIKALCNGVKEDFGSKAILEEYNLGTKSNITRIRTSLTEKEIIEVRGKQIFISDPVFELWFRREYLK